MPVTLKPVVILQKVKITNKCSIYIRVCWKRKVAYVITAHEIDPAFMLVSGMVSPKYPGQAKLNHLLQLKMTEYYNAIYDMDVDNMSALDITRKLKGDPGSAESITKYMETRSKEFLSEGRVSYSYQYGGIANQLRKYSGKDDILFREITSDFLNGFKKTLLKDHRISTVNKYLSKIGEAFNSAINSKIIKKELMPKFTFDKSPKTRKRNLSIEQIKKLLKLEKTPEQSQAWDLWMLSFYLLGANFVDMLNWTEIKNGRIEYMRSKTKKKKPEIMSVKVIPEAMEIIKRYRGEKHLLRFLDSENLLRKTSRHGDIIEQTNDALEKLSTLAGFDFKVTTYYARFSVASLAYKLNIQESTISEMLTHSHGNAMTNVYIDRDFSKVDKAQRKLVDKLYKGQ